MSSRATPPVEPIPPYPLAAGGWGSMKTVAVSVLKEGAPLTTLAALRHQNKADGFACTGCAWGKPARPRAAEFCDNGAKATAWELTDKRAGPDFFARHTLSELRQWSDLDLESAGRLTEPLRYDTAQDRYVTVTWDEAFAGIGRALKELRAP